VAAEPFLIKMKCFFGSAISQNINEKHICHFRSCVITFHYHPTKSDHHSPFMESKTLTADFRYTSQRHALTHNGLYII
jgi:hypothetical protein